VNQTVLLGWKNVLAQMQIVGGGIDQPERKHGWIVTRFSQANDRCRRSLPWKVDCSQELERNGIPVF
jgi:hypothetical protein